MSFRLKFVWVTYGEMYRGLGGTFKEYTITLVSPGRAHRVSCDRDSRFAIPTFEGFHILWQPMSTNMILSCSFHNYSIMYSKTPF